MGDGSGQVYRDGDAPLDETPLVRPDMRDGRRRPVLPRFASGGTGAGGVPGRDVGHGNGAWYEQQAAGHREAQVAPRERDPPTPDVVRCGYSLPVST